MGGVACMHNQALPLLGSELAATAASLHPASAGSCPRVAIAGAVAPARSPLPSPKPPPLNPSTLKPQALSPASQQAHLEDHAEGHVGGPLRVHVGRLLQQAGRSTGFTTQLVLLPGVPQHLHQTRLICSLNGLAQTYAGKQRACVHSVRIVPSPPPGCITTWVVQLPLCRSCRLLPAGCCLPASPFPSRPLPGPVLHQAAPPDLRRPDVLRLVLWRPLPLQLGLDGCGRM